MSTIKIVEPTFMPVTLEEAKSHCSIDHAYSDGDVAMAIGAALDMVEHEIMRTLATATYELSLDSFPTGEIEIFYPPIQSIVSVKYTDQDQVEQTVAPSDYSLVVDGIYRAWVAPAYGASWPETLCSANAVRVRYIAGYAEGACPMAIKRGLLAITNTLMENKGVMTSRNINMIPHLSRIFDKFRCWNA